MLSLDTIEQTILELESKDTTFSNCERLAPLYVVRDHLKGYNVSPEATLELSNKSEFLQAVNGKSPQAAWNIIDKHMESLKLLYPKTYNSILNQIKEL